MKIIFIDESLDRVGGVERVICTLANNLVKKQNVEVISELKIKKESFYKYDKNIKINYLINNENSIVAKMQKKNALYYIIRAYEKIKKKLLINNKIKKVLKDIDNNDTIVFGRVFTALDFLPLIKKYDIKANIIVRDAIHLEYYSKKIKNKILKFFPNIVSTFIVSSDESIKSYKNFFNNKSINIVKIYNPLGIMPIDCGSYENKTIVSIGRMDKQKGYESLIRAFKLVIDKFPDWKLRIYGEGTYKRNIQDLIVQLNLENKVFIMPTIKDITKAFNEASIFVLPSRYEGYANILVEAMSCGMPSISYNWLMGVEEIINNKENGLIVSLKDRYNYFKGIDSIENSYNLAETIIDLINDKELYKKIKNNSSKIIETRNVDVIVRKWLELIDKCEI